MIDNDNNFNKSVKIELISGYHGWWLDVRSESKEGGQ